MSERGTGPHFGGDPYGFHDFFGRRSGALCGFGVPGDAAGALRDVGRGDPSAKSALLNA
jgi:hypothetical protein